MTIITRFPPSPTGFMHIGNARTALYNWLYARHHGGKFVVRIEDTDRARHSEEAVLAILNSLKWLELDWDGEIVSQFEQRDRHVEIAKELIAKGQAYYCYCTPEELTAMRAQAKEEGRSTSYDRRWRDRDPAEAPEGVPPVIRIKAPLEGETTIHDQVQGDVSVSSDNLDDFILLRSDGTPTYMLSVVVDDHDMGITHIIRGDDHLNNAFRQKIIFEAMGWDIPVYAHIPLIHGADGGKFSKRHGATGVEEYKDMGYLPEAMRNYLLRLGWAHGDDEIISTAQAVEWFDLDHVGKSAARFDFAKLDSLNAHYLNEADDDRLVDLIYDEQDEIVKQRLKSGMAELKDRAKTLKQLSDESSFYTKKIPFDFDEKAQKILDEGPMKVLTDLQDRFKALPSFTAEGVEQACRECADELREGKLGKVAMPLRAALTGTTVSPSIFHAAEILGLEECLERIAQALGKCGEKNIEQHAVSN